VSRLFLIFEAGYHFLRMLNKTGMSFYFECKKIVNCGLECDTAVGLYRLITFEQNNSAIK